LEWIDKETALDCMLVCTTHVNVVAGHFIHLISACSAHILIFKKPDHCHRLFTLLEAMRYSCP